MQSHDDLNELSQEHKHRVLTTEPDHDTSSYPRTRPPGSDPYCRQFQPSWLKQHPWLHYSRHDDGVYSRACAFFTPKQVGGQDLGQFVTKPFKSWGKIFQKASAHATKNYHLSSMTRMSEFIARYENPSRSISTILDSELQRVMETNQKVVESLFKIALLCGRQGLALRGHRDDKISWMEDDDTHSNEGNFVELVRFQAETDAVLAEHLANTRYTSKTIQNELVEVIGDSIQNDIIAEVKQAKFYSVIADEVTDTANKEELSLSLRFVFNGRVKEVFVDFVEVERITGQVLAQAILQWLSTHGLSRADIRGQCYNSASNMSGAVSGCKSIVQQEAPLALYVHCAAHRLNLAVVYAYQQVNSAVTTLKKMREDSSCEFHQLFIETAQLGQQLHGDQFELSTPRIVGRQAHRSNPATSSPEEYFRITLFNEFLSHVISQFQDRFVDNPAHSIALGLLCLLPSECIRLESGRTLPTELAQAADLYTEDLPHSVMLSTEYNMWVTKWKQQHAASADVPNKLVDALHSCSAIQFPNLHVLLRVALTLPITSCESERSFS